MCHQKAYFLVLAHEDGWPQSLTSGLQELFRAFGNVLKSEFLKWFVSGNSNYFKLLVFCVCYVTFQMK